MEEAKHEYHERVMNDVYNSMSDSEEEDEEQESADKQLV